MFIYLLLGVCSIFWSQYNPDMKILGMWELQLYSIFHLFSTNRAESFNAWLKRNFPKRRAYTEDQIISGGHNIISGKLNRILRAQYSVGGGWLLRKELRHRYNIHVQNDFIQNEKTEESLLCDRLDAAENLTVFTFFLIYRESNVSYMFNINLKHIYFIEATHQHTTRDVG